MTQPRTTPIPRELHFQGTPGQEQLSALPQIPQLSIDHVSVQRAGTLVLDDINLTLNESRIGVIGPNGAGKSTLVRLLNGLVLPSTGTVRVGELSTTRDAKKVRRDVGFVFQNPANQIIMPMVEDDIAFGLKNLRLPASQRRERVSATLHELGINHLAHRESHTLSGGEQQMVALAAVLAMDPKVIVFDEPTTMLDLRNRLRFQREIARLPQRCLVVTHDLELLEDFDRVLVVTDGGIGFDGPPSAAVQYYRDWSAQ